jgi:hypothetical protein
MTWTSIDAYVGQVERVLVAGQTALATAAADTRAAAHATAAAITPDMGSPSAFTLRVTTIDDRLAELQDQIRLHRKH